MSLEEAKVFVNATYYKSSCTGYTVLLENVMYSGMHSTACYGGLRTNPVLFNLPIAIVNQLQTEYHGYYHRLPEGTPKAYLDWLVNRSVFADTFYEKDVDKILSEGVWVTRCDIPGNVMVAAMTCLRALTENDRSCRSGEVFLPLVQAGCTEEFAFILGHYMKDSALTTNQYDSHHCIFDIGGMTVETARNFLNKKFIRPRKLNWSEDKLYDGVHNLFYGSGESFPTWLIKAYNSIKDGAQELEKKESNPFSVAKAKSSYGLGLDEDKFEVMAKVCDLFYKEFIK